MSNADEMEALAKDIYELVAPASVWGKVPDALRSGALALRQVAAVRELCTEATEDLIPATILRVLSSAETVEAKQ